MDQLRIRQLHLLVEVAERASLISAARALNMTQPAATKALRQLEDMFGVPLVERSRRGSVLTPIGKGLYEHAKSVLATVRTAEIEVHERLTGQVGEVRLGVLPAALPALVPTALQLLHDRYPGIVARVITGDSSLLSKMLQEEKIEFLIGRIWQHDDPDIRSTMLFTSSFCLVARNGHPIFDEMIPTLKATLSYDWILPTLQSYGRAAIEAVFPANDLRGPHCSVETTSYMLTRELLRSSDMIACVDRTTLQRDAQDGLIRIINIDFNAVLPPIGIMSRTNHISTPAEQELVRCFKEAAQTKV